MLGSAGVPSPDIGLRVPLGATGILMSTSPCERVALLYITSILTLRGTRNHVKSEARNIDALGLVLVRSWDDLDNHVN